jgi:hypothetical protein
MHASNGRRKHLSPPAIAAALCLLFLFAARATAQEVPPADFKVAFIGDQGLGPNAVAVKPNAGGTP